MSGDVAFAGSVPALYERYGTSLLFGPYAEEVAWRLRDVTAGRLLETAAGTGIVTVALAEALPAAVEIVATDLNPAMLAVAAAKPALARVTLAEADALSLPWPDGSFDVVVCQFGVMFFPDRVAGMREARRVLRPGGRLLLSAWCGLEDNPMVQVVVSALSARHPSHPSWFIARTPHGYGDPARVAADMAAAGWEDVSVDVVERVSRAEDARAAALFYVQGTPMRGELEALEGGSLEGVTAVVEDALRAAHGEGPVAAPMRALMVEARA